MASRKRKPTLGVVRGDAPANSAPTRSYERGVYRPDWTTPGGETTLYAIDSRGRKVVEAIVSEQGEVYINAQLWKFLEAVDPVKAAPLLALVK